MAFWLIAAAALPSVFGLQLGAPISLPECKIVPGLSIKAYAVDQTAPCWESPIVLSGDVLPSTPIDFPAASAPLIVKNARIYALPIDGKVESIMFLTPGAGAQSLVMAELRKKFGPPSSETTSTVGNALGATFNAIDARWTIAGAEVRYRGVADRIDSGEVTIDTAKAKALREAREKATEGQRTPL